MLVPHSVSLVTTKLEGVCVQLSSVGAVPALILDVMYILQFSLMYILQFSLSPITEERTMGWLN